MCVSKKCFTWSPLALEAWETHGASPRPWEARLRGTLFFFVWRVPLASLHVTLLLGMPLCSYTRVNYIGRYSSIHSSLSLLHAFPC